MPPRNNTSSGNTNADQPTIQQLLQSLSSSIPSGQSDRFPSANNEITEQFRQLQRRFFFNNTLLGQHRHPTMFQQLLKRHRNQHHCYKGHQIYNNFKKRLKAPTWT
jgi:hypothetical protein